MTGMQETALDAIRYLQDNLGVMIVLALVMGILAVKTVSHWDKTSIATYVIVGVLGTFLGQFVVRYIGLKEVLDQAAGMALLFDVVLAYFGAFIIASLVHLFKPM